MSIKKNAINIVSISSAMKGLNISAISDSTKGMSKPNRYGHKKNAHAETTE